MKHWKQMILCLTVCILLAGCNTLKGAQEGFQDDWEDWNRQDGWIQENLW